MFTMKMKKLLKKLCILNIVTLMSCNLVPNQTFAETYNVPISGGSTSTITLDSSQIGNNNVSFVPPKYTGDNVTLNIKINRKEVEVDPAAAEFKQAANLFAQAVDLAHQNANNDSENKETWVALANAFKEAAFHTAKAAFTNKDKSSTVYQKFLDAYNAANGGNSGAATVAANDAYDAAVAAGLVDDAVAAYSAAKSAADAAVAADFAADFAAYFVAAYAASAAKFAADAAKSAADAYAAKSAAYATVAAYSAAKSAADAAYAAFAADAAVADSADGVAKPAATAANDAYNKARAILGNEEANKYQLTSEDYTNWDAENFKDAKDKAQAAADAIVVDEGGQDFADAIYGDKATHDLWVRLTAKTKDENGNDISPNSNESTDWIKIETTKTSESEDKKSITISVDTGKALMPGDYNVNAILTSRKKNIENYVVTSVPECAVAVDDASGDVSIISAPAGAVVVDGNTVLEEGRDYSISYNDYNPTDESCTATITGIGDYTGKIAVKCETNVTHFGDFGA